MMAKAPCTNCDDTGWVCENHPDRPSRGFSEREDAKRYFLDLQSAVCRITVAVGEKHAHTFTLGDAPCRHRPPCGFAGRPRIGSYRIGIYPGA